eukprot:741289-Pyramimonas_sp.AAC.1
MRHAHISVLVKPWVEDLSAGIVASPEFAVEQLVGAARVFRDVRDALDLAIFPMSHILSSSAVAGVLLGQRLTVIGLR